MKTLMYRLQGIIPSLVFACVCAQIAQAAERPTNFPARPLRMVTAEAGGGPDFVARLIAPHLSGTLGQQVIVDNRGLMAIEIVAKAAPDGHSMLLYGASIWLMPYLRDNVPWDPIRDFAPITLAFRVPNIVVVHPSLAANSVTELIALARARPGVLNYSTSSPGATSTLGAELFKAMAKVDIVRVSYKGTGAALNSLIAGEVQIMFPTASGAIPHIKSGRLRGLAVTTAQPSALLPGLPTVAASGLPGYESVALDGIFAPARTPEPVIKLLNQEIVRALNRTEVKERFLAAGVEPIGSTPDELMAAMKAEMPRMAKIIKDAGIRDE